MQDRFAHQNPDQKQGRLAAGDDQDDAGFGQGAVLQGVRGDVSGKPDL